MIDPRDRLTVKHDSGGFTDLSEDAADLVRDNFNLTLLSTDYLYLGFEKPFNRAFIALITENTNAADLTAEIYNGSSWVEPTMTQDETKGFNRSGFVQWSKESMQPVEIDSVTKYYVRFSLSADSSAMVARGLNLIFSDDSRMKANYPPINSSKFYPQGEASHLLTHVAVRDEMIMKLRNRYRKRNNNVTDVWEMINVWDLIDIFEMREAATYLAVAKTFHNISDNVEDQWYEKYKHYLNKFDNAFNSAFLSVDTDDDGTDDEEEVQKTKESASLIR